MGADHQHRVCTYKEAEEAIKAHNKIYVNNCYCRTPAKRGETPWEYCGHATEVCMGFYKSGEESQDYPVKEISQEEALKRFNAWKQEGNFFRFMDNEEWICFCCACGCDWFRDKDGNKRKDTCDKSLYIEQTDMGTCNNCGICVEICPYDARSLDDGDLNIESADCYGCSACEYVCPEGAIAMVMR